MLCLENVGTECSRWIVVCLELATMWPVLLGGQAHWTVGLISTIIAMSTVIAADTGAFLGGRVCFNSQLALLMLDFPSQ